MTESKHVHKWSEPICDGTIQVCENGPCGAVRETDADEILTVIYERVEAHND
jgi:hypothetical protein